MPPSAGGRERELLEKFPLPSPRPPSLSFKTFYFGEPDGVKAAGLFPQRCGEGSVRRERGRGRERQKATRRMNMASSRVCMPS